MAIGTAAAILGAGALGAAGSIIGASSAASASTENAQAAINAQQAAAGTAQGRTSAASQQLLDFLAGRDTAYQSESDKLNQLIAKRQEMINKQAAVAQQVSVLGKRNPTFASLANIPTFTSGYESPELASINAQIKQQQEMVRRTGNATQPGGAQDYQDFLREARALAGGASPYISQDYTNANEFAAALAAPQLLALQNAFKDQRTQYNQMAARLGRNVDDPILNAKLAQEQTRQLSQLSATQAAAAAQEAQRLSSQRIATRADLANRALQNKLSYLNMGLSDLGMQFQSGQQIANIYANRPATPNPFATGITGLASGMQAGSAIANYFNPQVATPQVALPTGGSSYSGISIPTNLNINNPYIPSSNTVTYGSYA